MAFARAAVPSELPLSFCRYLSSAFIGRPFSSVYEMAAPGENVYWRIVSARVPGAVPKHTAIMAAKDSATAHTLSYLISSPVVDAFDARMCQETLVRITDEYQARNSN